MRLIDADRLMEDFRNTITEQSDTYDWLNMISRQPIAYDVNRVKNKFKEVGNIQFQGYTKPLIAVEEAMEIVESGFN